VIDAVADGYNNVRAVQSIGERFSDCPPMSDRSGRCVVSMFEAIFDDVLVTIVTPTAQSSSNKGSLIAEAVNENHGLGEVVFLGETMKKRRCRISVMPSVQFRFKNKL